MAENQKKSTDEVLSEVGQQSYLKSYIQNPLGFSTTTGLSADPEAPFREGVAAGAAQVVGDFKQFSALRDLIKGNDESAKIKLQKADALYAQADEISQLFTQFENAFDSAGDFGEYAKLQLGKLAPQIVGNFGTGFASAIVYGLGKQLVKQGTKKYIKNKAVKIANKEKAGIALNNAEKKFLQEGYEGQAYLKLLKNNQKSWNEFALDQDAAKLTGKVFGTKVVGGVGLNAKTAFWAGSFAQSEVIGGAQSAQEYRDQGIELTSEEAALAMLYGVPQALLDTASEFVFFRGALKVAAGELKNAATEEGKRQAASVVADILKASAIQAGQSAVIEGLTETSQEGVIIAQRLYDPLGGGKYADPTYDNEMIRMRLLESGFVGALAGGARGAGGGVIAKSYDLLANKEDNRADIEAEAARIRKYGSPAQESMSRISAQIDDLFNPKVNRNIVFMPKMSMKSLEAMGSSDSTLGVATLDVNSLMQKYPSLGFFESSGRNPGLFIFDENNPVSNGIRETIQNGQEVTDDYLKDVLGFFKTQQGDSPFVLVTRNKQGVVVKAEAVGFDEDGSTTSIDKAEQKARKDYPVSEGYDTQRMDKADYQTELANEIEVETPTPVQAEFDFGDAEQDPDIIKAKEDEQKLNVKDVTSVTRDGNRVRIETTDEPSVRPSKPLTGSDMLGTGQQRPRTKLEQQAFDNFRQDEQRRAEGQEAKATATAAKYIAYKTILQKNSIAVRDPDTRQPKTVSFKYNGRLQVGTKDGLTAFRGEFSLLEALAINEALQTEAKLNVLQPIVGPEKNNGKRDITFRVRGFSQIAMQAESEGPRYNKDRIAEQSTGYEDSSASAPDASRLPSVASLENFDDVKGFLYARKLLQTDANSRALNASGEPVSRKAARAWAEGGSQFSNAGFFTPLSRMSEDRRLAFTPTLDLRRKLQGLLSTEIEGGLVGATRLEKTIVGFNKDIPAPVYQAIIDAHSKNPDIELTVVKTNRQGEIISDVAYEARDSKTEVIKRTRKVGEDELGKPIFEEFTMPKQEVVKVPNQEDSFYRVIELLQSDRQETLLINLKSSFNTARKIERPYKDTNLKGDALTSKFNRWNSSPYAEAFRVRLDPLQKNPEIIKRNKKALNNSETRVVSLKQLLTGEAKRRLSDTSFGTSGIISQEEYQKIIRLEDNKLVFDNFMSLLVSLKEGGFILEYGEAYPRKDDNSFNFDKRIPENKRYTPVIERDDKSLKAIEIPEFKNNAPKPPTLVRTLSNKPRNNLGSLVAPERPSTPSEYTVPSTISALQTFKIDEKVAQAIGRETGQRIVSVPNPNIKEQQRLSRSLNKIPFLKKTLETILTRNTFDEIETTINDLGLENSDIAGFGIETTLEKIAKEKNNKTIKDKDKTKLTTTQKEVLDRSIIRGILGLTSKEDTHADYPFKNSKGGVDFLESVELTLDMYFYTFSEYLRNNDEASYNLYLEAKNSPLLTGDTKIGDRTQSDFEVTLDAALDTLQIVLQTLEARFELQSQPPVVGETLEVEYTDITATGETDDTYMFASASIVSELRNMAGGERGVVINRQQAAFGADATKLSGPGRVDETAEKWRDYDPLRKSGKTTFGPKIKELFDEKFVGFPIPNRSLSFSSIEALDRVMRGRFKNTRDITVLSVDDKLPNLGLEPHPSGLGSSSVNIKVAKIKADMIANKEPAKYIGFSDSNSDLIILNPYAYATRPSENADSHKRLRQVSLYYEAAHEMGHSIIEDQLQKLFNFNNGQLREDFMGVFTKAKADLEAKGDMKYSDPRTGPHEFLADQIAALALADIQLKDDSPIRKQIGLQNAEGVARYSFDKLLTTRLRAFLRGILNKLKGFIGQVHKIYNDRFRLARTPRGDIDTRFLSSLNKTLGTFRNKGDNDVRLGNRIMQRIVILDAASVTYKDFKKYVNKKQAKKLKGYLARQASKMYNSELGLKRAFGHPAEHWSMKYMFSSAASYLTSKSLELGKAFYGLTQSEDDFGYKRTYLIIQNQKMSDLLATLPTDKKGNPDFKVLQEATAIAEDYDSYPTNVLSSANPTEKVALGIRQWLDEFFQDYIQDPQNPNKIKFMQDFFPRLWSMAELRSNSKAREVLADLLFNANKDKVDKVKNKKGEIVEVPHKVTIEDYKTGKLVDYPASERSTWDLFTDKWLGTDQDSDTVLLEDDEFNIDQNRKRPNSDIDNLSIGMTKSRADYFVNLTTGAIRAAETEFDVTLLSPPENALRRYVQDTVKKIEYNKQVQTAFTIEDYERMAKRYPNKKDIPFAKPKKVNIAAKGMEPLFTQEYPVFGARAAEVMISRIDDPAERQGARKAVEGLLGKSGAGMSPFMRQVNSWGLLLNWFGYLSFAVLASAPDMAGPLFRGKGLIGISDIVKEAVVPWTKDADFAKQFAIDIGVVSHDSITSMFIDAAELGYMNETTQKWAGLYFKGIGLDWYTNFTRKFAAGLGEQFIFRLATAKQTLQTTRWLRELGLTADDVIYWHNQNGDKGRGKRDFSTPQGEKVRMAIAQFVEESILRPGASERPVWASNPYFALVFQLKSFFYAYGKTIIGGVYREAVNSYADNIAQGKKPSSALFGATAPVALGATALLALTALGLELRELIKYLANGGDSTKFRSNNMNWGEYMFEMTDRAGILGPLGILIPIFEAPGYGDSMILESLGPMAGRVDDLLVQGNIATNPEDSFWSFVPIASGLELDWF